MHAHTRQWRTKKSKRSEWTQWDEAQSGRLNLWAAPMYTGVQWALEGRPHTCRHMAWRHLCLLYSNRSSSAETVSSRWLTASLLFSTLNAQRCRLWRLMQITVRHHARRSLSTVGGDTQWPINPPTTVLLSFTFILPLRNGLRSHSRCGTESWTELELAFHLTVTFLIRLQGTNNSLH